ncbi:MAG TPA: hypothetical protein VFC23_08070 [Thermoanaerobaculia bacterium]|nr:hypothetical protein [Thermoanaerobaculia bacterium]
MYRRTAHRGIAALALILTLTLVGAQPAAAATARSSKVHFTGFWGAVLDVVPGAHAVVDTLAGLFHVADTTTTTTDPGTSEKGWGIDPNGNSLNTLNPGTTTSGL